jgi:hypothetical protein
MSSFEPNSLRADAFGALAPSARYAFDTLSPGAGYAAHPQGSKIAPIAEALTRAEKMAAMADSLSDQLGNVTQALIGPGPAPAGGDKRAEHLSSQSAVHRLNDTLTDLDVALNRMAFQIGRLQGAIG